MALCCLLNAENSFIIYGIKKKKRERKRLNKKMNMKNKNHNLLLEFTGPTPKVQTMQGKRKRKEIQKRLFLYNQNFKTTKIILEEFRKPLQGNPPIDSTAWV